MGYSGRSVDGQPYRVRFLASSGKCAALCALVVLAASIAASVAAPGGPDGDNSRPRFDTATLEQGARLAAVGGCSGCHTVPGGMPYAGGVPLQTPFGTIYGTNITPHAIAGIGRWSERDFVRAMRDGVDRSGRHLYPAFPYPHFALVSDDELHALYAYVMSRTPVDYVPPANRPTFPFNVRPLLAVWNALHLHGGDYRPDPARSAQWNRGAYLVQSLGHCGACHTPLDALGAETRDEYLGGGSAEGWYAPPLDAHNPSPVPWTAEALATYLRRGIVDEHAMAGGPMQDVVQELAQASDEDVMAMAVYLVSLMDSATSAREARANGSLAMANASFTDNAASDRSATTNQPPSGAGIYSGACASCHAEGRRASSGTALQLPLAVAVHEADPASLIRIIREGITAPEGERGRWMPAFAGALTDEQITALVIYLRTLAPDAPPWQNVAEQIAKARSS
jgi:mono/diheme cytochrome c family protein